MRLTRFSLFGAMATVQGFMDEAAEGGEGGGGQAAAPAEPQGTQSAAAPAISADQQAILDRVTQNVGAAVEAAMAPGLDRIAALEQRLDDATQPAGGVNGNQNASNLYGGGSANIRQGEDAMASRGYEVQRAMGFSQQRIGADQAQLECEYSNFLRQSLYQYGFTGAGQGPNALLVPMWQHAIPHDVRAEANRKFGDYHQLMQQAVRGAGNDGGALLEDICGRQGIDPNSNDAHAIRQTLSVFDDSALGIFTSPGPKGEFIALLRAAEVLSRAGARSVALPPNGYLPYGRQTGAGTAYWVGENSSITTSEPTTGTLELRAKKLACRIVMPNELRMFGGPEVELFLRADMVINMALKLDLAGLEGAGSSTSPLGIINHSGITTHTASLTQAANGDTFEPDTVGAMLSDLAESNHNPEDASCSWVMRPKMWYDNLTQRRADSVSASDAAGDFLFDVGRDINGAVNQRLHGRNVVLSTQVANTRTKGASSDLSYVLLGCFKEVLIGRIGVIEFATQVEGDTVFANYQTGLRAVQHVDIGIRHEDAFVFADDIDMDLT